MLSGQDYVSQARENRVRKVRIEAPRGDIVDRNNVKLVGPSARAVVQLVPSQLPEAVRDQADEYRKELAAAENERLARRRPHDAFERQLRDDGRKNTKAREEASAASCKKEADAARPVAVPEPPGDETDAAELYRRMGEVIDISPKTIHQRVIRGIADAPYSNVTIRTDVPPAQFNYMRERPEYFPGVVVTKRYLRRYPQARARGAAVRHGLRDHRRAAQATSEYAGIEQGTRIGQSGLEKHVRQVPARRSTAPRASSSTRSAAATSSARRRSPSPSRASG